MKYICTSALVAAVLALAPVAASAQTKSTPTQPGASANAPGQKAQKTGKPANTYAPGQMEKKNDMDKQPGAKEYAPGQKQKK